MSRVASICFAGCLLLVVGSASSFAHADSPWTIARGWYVSPGLPFALSVRDGQAGLATGVEVSVAGYETIGRPGHGWWTGLYADALRDAGSSSSRLSMGPELGRGVLGVDGGYVLERAHGRSFHGACVRPLLSLGFAILYGRVGWVPHAPKPIVAEAGLLLKVPINFWCDPAAPGCG